MHKVGQGLCWGVSSHFLRDYSLQTVLILHWTDELLGKKMMKFGENPRMITAFRITNILSRRNSAMIRLSQLFLLPQPWELKFGVFPCTAQLALLPQKAVGIWAGLRNWWEGWVWDWCNSDGTKHSERTKARYGGGFVSDQCKNY